MNLSPLFPIAAAAFAMQSGNGQDTASVARQVDAMYPRLEAIYKDLHAHPELAFRETRTAAKLAAEMRATGFEVTEKVGKTGLVAIYRNGAGPTVLVRTELDGLPMEEKTGFAYASKNHGQLDGKDTLVAHSCGHDIHMASWLGAARALVALKSQWKGTLMFIAQPAEEIGGGAKAMLADGLFKRFAKPDYAFALHTWPLAYDTIGYNSGIGVPVGAAIDNNDPLVQRTATVLKQAFGDANVSRMPAMSASEDFSEFVNQGVPSMFFFTGIYDPKAVAESEKAGGKSLAFNHSPYYAPVPEPSIKTAAEAMSLAVLNVMPHR
jgi:metal-dependent amidase/aminoacylase/carboxypeptidase family protein